MEQVSSSKNETHKPQGIGPFIWTAIFFLLLLAGLLMWFFGQDRGYDYEDPAGVYPLSRQIKYSVMVGNTTGRHLDKAQFWLYGPVARGATQSTVDLTVSQKHRVFSDEVGNQVLYFEFSPVEAGVSSTITIEANVVHSDEPNPLANADLNRYLNVEPFIEVNSPEIRDLSVRLKGADANETVANILSSMGERLPMNQEDPGLASPVQQNAEEGLGGHTAYTVIPENDADVKLPQASEEVSTSFGPGTGALAVLKEQHRSASGDLYLFLAICRAAGIPARGLVGFRLERNGPLSSQDAALWAEFFDGARWKIADLEQRHVAASPSTYLVLRVIDRITQPAGWQAYAFLYESAGLAVVPGSVRVRVLASNSNQG